MRGYYCLFFSSTELGTFSCHPPFEDVDDRSAPWSLFDDLASDLASSTLSTDMRSVVSLEYNELSEAKFMHFGAKLTTSPLIKAYEQ